MKNRSILLASGILAACLFACQCGSGSEDVPVPEPVPGPDTPVDPVIKPEAGTYTFVLPDYAVKQSWLAGDEISVRGNYSPEAITVTLKQSEISSDGKTATVSLSTIPSTFCAPDWLYAAYPASSVELDGTFCDQTTRFTKDDVMLVAYWKEGNSFEFRPGGAAVTFSVDGSGYDAVVFGGASREDLVYDYLTVTYSSEQELSTSKPSEGHPFIEKAIPSDGKITVFLPAKVQLKGGFSIYMKKDGSYPLFYEYTDAVTFAAGQVIDLGDITSSLKSYEGPVPEEMKMPEVLAHTKYNVNVQELSGICLTEDGEALWAVGDEGQLAIVTIKDGNVDVQKIKHFDTDLEGVTRDPFSGDLHVCIEGSQRIARIPAPDFTKREDLFVVQEAVDKSYGNSGLEGITWYKDSTIYVGSQVGANLWRYNLKGEILDFISLKTVKPGILEVGGLCYDAVNDWLWVTDSEAHALWVFTGDARTYLGKYKLPYIGNNESVCVDHAHDCVWVGDDDDSQPHIFKLDMKGLTPEAGE